MAVVEPGRVDEFLAVCAKWDVRAAVIGEVTDTGRLVMTWHGETVVDIPPASAADGPVYHRPLARPASQDALAADDPAALPRPADGAGLRADLLALLGSPGLADKSWVTDQYDRYVRGDTVLAMPEDARAAPGGRGDRARHRAGHRRQRPLLPARPVPGHPAGAVRGVPERGGDRRAPARRHELPELRLAGGPRGDVAVRRGRARARRRLRRPRRAGHRRQRQLLQPDRDGGHPPHPGRRGARRARRRAPAGRRSASPATRTGHASCCSAGPRPEFGGSAWAHVLHGHLGGRPPAPDLDAERRLAALLAAAAADGLLAAAHDLSDGGLAVALAESCLRGGVGCRVRLPGDPFTALFSESAGRAIVAVRPGAEPAFGQLRAAHGVPGRPSGPSAATSLVVDGCFSIRAGRARRRARPGRCPRCSADRPAFQTERPGWPMPPRRPDPRGPDSVAAVLRALDADAAPGLEDQRDGGAVPALPAGRPPSGPGPGGADPAGGRRAVPARAGAHPGHAAERGRDRPAHLDPAGARAASAGPTRSAPAPSTPAARARILPPTCRCT